MPGQAAGPLLERGGLRRQGDALPARGLAVGRRQILEQHAPGDPVHHQVVGDPEELLRLPGAEVEEAQASQRSGRKVEARLERRGSPLDGRRAGAPLAGPRGPPGGRG